MRGLALFLALLLAVTVSIHSLKMLKQILPWLLISQSRKKIFVVPLFLPVPVDLLTSAFDLGGRHKYRRSPSKIYIKASNDCPHPYLCLDNAFEKPFQKTFTKTIDF